MVEPADEVSEVAIDQTTGHPWTGEVERYPDGSNAEEWILGYEKLDHFLPRSGSENHVMRFFGFAFAATLYNCWRLVDLLVKLSVNDNPAYKPLVTASRFLAVVKGMFGLKAKPPPD